MIQLIFIKHWIFLRKFTVVRIQDVTFSLNTSNIELLEEKFFLRLYSYKNNRFDKYNIALKDNGKLFELLKHEKGLGLNGAAGAFHYISIRKYLIQHLLIKELIILLVTLVNLDGARGVKFRILYFSLFD